MRPSAGRIGVDPIRRVVLMENHDQAYHIWQRAGARDRIVLHLDAHHDLWWSESVASMTISNFLSQALQAGTAREIVWVVPDGTWQGSAGRTALRKHLRDLHRMYPGHPSRVHEEPRRIVTALLGRRLTICALDTLPPLNEAVLLDIDVDYFVIPRVFFGPADEHAPMPWQWPRELIAALAARHLRTDLATVAFSVEGGYTPLEWKYLGEEIHRRLTAPASPRATVAFDWMREAAEARRGDALARAGRLYRRAADLCPGFAWPGYQLAQLHSEQGRLKQGRDQFRAAIRLDASYRNGSALGFHRYRGGHVTAAERAFRRGLELDPDDAGALLGLGLAAMRRRRWAVAERWLRRAIAADTTSIDAYRALGSVLAQRRAYDGAIAAYRRSLRLAMAGHRPLEGPIATAVRPGLVDADHWKTYALLAGVLARTGQIAPAVASGRISLAAGCGGVALRRRLARLVNKSAAQ